MPYLPQEIAVGVFCRILTNPLVEMPRFSAGFGLSRCCASRMRSTRVSRVSVSFADWRRQAWRLRLSEPGILGVSLAGDQFIQV